jgi:hypothetical protein
MTIHRSVGIFVSIAVLALTNLATAQSKGKYVCAEPKPQSLCNAGNTCLGSGSCTVDIKKKGSGATATPGFPDAKDNSVFCVKQGTTVTFQSTAKNTGFVVDFGPSSPFDPPDAIIGGAEKPVQAKANRPGCFKYSAGACVSGATYGMCGSTTAEAVVIGSK